MVIIKEVILILRLL